MRTPEYTAWCSLRAMCSNPKRRDFKSYGGRGITCCQRWDDFAAFIADVGRRPSPDHSLQRLDINGDYCPENVRWLPRERQNVARRPVRRVVLEGREMSLRAAERLLLGRALKA